MVTENRVRGGLFGTSLRRARVFNSRRSVCFALPLGTLALCTFQAARRGRRGEGASVSGVSRLRVLDAVLAGVGRFKTEYFIDGASVLIDEAVVKERLHFTFEAELSPIHRSTSTVHYRVFKRRLAGASLFKGGVHVRTTTTCTLSAMARPFR